MGGCSDSASLSTMLAVPVQPTTIGLPGQLVFERFTGEREDRGTILGQPASRWGGRLALARPLVRLSWTGVIGRNPAVGLRGRNGGWREFGRSTPRRVTPAA